MNRFRNWLMRVMSGRYGQDHLGRFLMILAIIVFIVSIFTSSYVYFAALAIVIYAYFRMFSRNIYARRKENDWYLRRTAKIRNFFYKSRAQRERNRNYKIFKCPRCKQKLRVPKGRGRIEIRCRKCSEIFIRKS